MNRRLHLLLLGTLAALSACGGGGGGGSSSGAPQGPTPSSVAGLYDITLSANSSSVSASLLILDDQSIWILGAPGPNAGLIGGTYTLSGYSISSSDTRDYSFSPGTPLTGFSGSFGSEQSTITGTLSESGMTASFSANRVNSGYNYSTSASVSSAVGAWAMTLMNGTPISISISATGRVSGTAPTPIDGLNCLISGTLSPKNNGTNVYDLNVTFGTPCSTNTIGVAYIVKNQNGTSTLNLVYLTIDRSSAGYATGTK